MTRITFNFTNIVNYINILYCIVGTCNSFVLQNINVILYIIVFRIHNLSRFLWYNILHVQTICIFDYIILKYDLYIFFKTFNES